MARITPAARIPIPNAGPEKRAPTNGIADITLPTGSLEIFGKQRGENKQTPHAINDTGNRRQQFNRDPKRTFQPAVRQLRQEEGDTKTYRDSDQ